MNSLIVYTAFFNTSTKPNVSQLILVADYGSWE